MNCWKRYDLRVARVASLALLKQLCWAVPLGRPSYDTCKGRTKSRQRKMIGIADIVLNPIMTIIMHTVSVCPPAVYKCIFTHVYVQQSTCLHASEALHHTSANSPATDYVLCITTRSAVLREWMLGVGNLSIWISVYIIHAHFIHAHLWTREKPFCLRITHGTEKPQNWKYLTVCLQQAPATDEVKKWHWMR